MTCRPLRSQHRTSQKMRQPHMCAILETHRRIMGGIMKYLLTSAGIKNTSIHNALVDLLGKPIAESSALCIPTAIYPFSVGPAMAYRFIRGLAASPLTELGWKSLGVLELTALPSIKRENWVAS